MSPDASRLTSRGGVSYLLYSNHHVPLVLSVRAGLSTPPITRPQVSGIHPTNPSEGPDVFCLRNFLKDSS